MNRVISLLFLLFASLSLKAQELPKPSQKWTMGANAHFQVLSTVSNTETTELVEDFEQFRAMLHGVLGEGAAKGSLMELPARIYLFQDSRQFDRYTSLTSRVGFFAHDPQGFRMALIASESEARRIVYHEYFHYHLRRVAPDLVPPLWANEGLACFYETARFEKKNVIIGIADANRLLSLFQRQPMPMSQLVNVHHRSPEYTVEAETQRFYATSWLAAHYLTIGNVNRRRQLPEYLGRIRAGQSQEQAFVAAFKTTYSGLDEELLVYLRSLRMSTPVFKAPPQAALDLKPLELGPASYAEALAQLGMLLGQQPEKQTFAKAHFQKALEVDPRCATAMAGLSQLEPEKARSLLDGAIALRPDPMFWLMRARLGFGQGAITEEGLEAILSDLASAARQGVGDAYHLEPVTYILPAGPRLSAQGLDSVRDLAAKAPTNFKLRLGLAQCLRVAGKYDEALKEAQALVPGASTDQRIQLQAFFENLHQQGEQGRISANLQPQEKDQEVAQKVHRRIKDAEALLDKKDTQGALAIFKEIQSQPHPRELTDWLQATIEQLERSLARPKPARSGKQTGKAPSSR